MSSAKGIIRVLGLCCISPLVFAADLPGSQDLPSVARQVDAQIVDYRPAEEKERIYPMARSARSAASCATTVRPRPVAK